MGKIQSRTAAVIDIGSSGVRMLISQWNGTAIEHLDYLEQPVQLGQEVMATGYVTISTVRELSAILNGFCSVAQQYGIQRVYAAATTALRDAANQAYILDHLAIQNKLRVRVLGDSEIGSLLFHSMRGHLPDPASRWLQVYCGFGAIEFALKDRGDTAFTHSLHSGLLKLGDLLREASEFTLQAADTAREYLDPLLSRQWTLLGEKPIDHLLFGIGSAEPLLLLCGRGGGHISFDLTREEIAAAYCKNSALSSEQIGANLDIDQNTALDTQAALILLHTLVQTTGVTSIRCVEMTLANAFMDLLLCPGSRKSYSEGLYAGTVASALELSRRYRCDIGHVRRVADLATVLFDRLRKRHGLSKKHKIMLQAACLLHELGRGTNAVDPQEASFQMVKDTQISGLFEGDTLLVANIIAPQSLLGVERGAPRSDLLPDSDVLVAAKLHALLHLADAVDFTRRQRAQMRSIELVAGEQLIVHLAANGGYALERIMLRQSTALFQEVFGITAEIRLEEKHGVGGDG